MNIFEPGPGWYDYKLFPAYAKYLLNNHLDEYVREQLTLARRYSLPLLKHLSHYSDEQILEFGKQSAREFLTYLSNNQAGAQIRSWLQKWKTDTLQIIGKFNIAAEDITIINFLRCKALKKFISGYPIPAEQRQALLDEIDDFVFGSVTSGTYVFIDILKDKIENELHFNSHLIHTSPGIIFIYDLIRNKEVYINGNVKKIMGYSAEEILAVEDNLLLQLAHPDDLPLLQKHTEGLLREDEGKVSQVEYRFRHKDGNYRWLRTYDVIFRRDHKGSPVEVLGTSFEITKEREISMALEKREAQLLEAQSIARIGSFEWDLEKDHTVNTPELNRIFELEPGQRQTEFMRNVHADDRQMVENAFSESLVTGKYDCQFRYVAKSSEKVLWGRGVVVFKENKPVTMRGTVQDITTMKKIESELLEKTRALERSNESLQQFASIASHDLKEPLRKMSMYTDMVLMQEEKILAGNSRVNLEKVKASSIRMQKMIDDILNFSTITKAEQWVKADLKKIIEDARLILQETIQEKNVVILYDNLTEVKVVPTQFRQLFQNLFSNAIKFSKPGQSPVITISSTEMTPGEDIPDDVQKADRYIEIRIRDNGIGFKQEHARKIFGLFTRLHPREDFDGSGLGLAICRRIVENHGGSISAQSLPGKGATFIVVLPVKD